jgi:murein DD-endopeptidase MepM/ murein hydrolase activator NlpD
MFLSKKKLSIISILALVIPSAFGLSLVIKDSCQETTLKKNQSEIFEVSYSILDSNNLVTREKFYISDEMGWPVEDVVISSHYGVRDHGDSCHSCSRFHEGVDFTPGEGKNVLAAMNGRVVEIDYIGGYGLFIRLEHDVNGGKWETVYAHLQNTSVPENIYIGKEVEIGEVIGKVGRTGLATGPHLHFEVRINGKKVNPLPLLYKNTSSI